ncbi:MAG: ABC transporter substrate-binding protein [Chlamydiia bacterium]|nr:ABC transporter substrate-binding protein [Chlamydiia bacterium]MCP5508811.1 ABC transporter substrate-binding protein [Chlamydiales bacterium]HPE85443.1 ABC transporter substrate-binding protein [Chlamydiales bacterium]
MTYPILRAAVCSLRLLLDWSPNPNHIPLAQKQFFEQEKIDLVLTREEPADLSIKLAPQFIRSGEKSSVIAVLVDQALQGFCIPKDAPFDLNGKIIGVKPQGTTASLARHFWKDLTFINKRDFGVVDAIGGTFKNVEPYLFDRPVRFIPWTDLGVPNYPELLIVGDIDADVAKRFRRALTASIAYCRKHPNVVFSSDVGTEQRSITLDVWARSQKVDLKPLKEWLSCLD